MKEKITLHFSLPEKVHRSNEYFTLWLLLFLFTACNPSWKIYNPYKKVDWENHSQYKGNLHTHTTRSDGSLNPQTVVDKYHQLGYSVLAITDHNEVTYPWTGFASMQPSGISKKRVESDQLKPDALNYENRDPGQTGMIDILACELSNHHHMGSFFNDTNGTLTVEESLKSTYEKGGLVIFNHPGRYNYGTSWYAELYKRHKHLIGMEIYNQGDRYPNDRRLWDSVLFRLMPGRPVWGFSNDDMHSERALGRNWTAFVLPRLSEKWVKRGMKEGRFYYVYAPEGHSGPAPPVIKAIAVHREDGIIDISVSGQDSIRWISNGHVIHKGHLLDLDDYPGISGYVRVEIFGPGNTITGTQAFGIRKRR